RWASARPSQGPSVADRRRSMGGSYHAGGIGPKSDGLGSVLDTAPADRNSLADRSVGSVGQVRMKGTPSTAELSSRDKSLDAAETLFAKRGYAGVGLSELAEVVGLGKSSLFHHFENKAQLYAAVAARILGRIEERLVRSLAKGGDPLARLERWLD